MDGLPLRSRLKKKLTIVFGVDPRSLALFRILLSVVILADVILRFPGLEAFMTDQGILDRQMAHQMLRADYGSVADVSWSLNYLSGDLWFQQLMLGLLAIAALFLLLGLGTRLATIACWILVVSFHMRCPIILSSGDTLLRNLLFWSMFAPLGRYWSLDQRWSGRELPDNPPPIFTAGTAGLIFQMVMMYFFAGLAKWNDVWLQGEAMDYVLRLDIYARPWARTLLEYPLLLKLISWSTLYGEVFLILLLLLPWRNTWWRTINLALYIVLHLSIATTMNIGLFSYISMVGWLPILPAAFWNMRWWNRWAGDFAYGSDEVPEVAPEIVVSPTVRRDWTGGLALLGNGFATLMIFYTLMWNISNLSTSYDGDLMERLEMTEDDHRKMIQRRRPYALAMPSTLRWVGVVTGTAQHFQMFGVPPLISPWFVYEATLEDGTQIDLLRLEPVSYEAPQSTLASIPGHHWRKLHRNCLTQPLAPVRPRIAEYLIRRWNQTHRSGKQVQSLRVTCYLKKTGPQYQNQNPEIAIWYDSGTRSIESLDDLERLLDGNPNLLPGL